MFTKMGRVKELKKTYPEAILLLRNAEVYEIYGEDAKKVAEAIGKEIRNNMCSFQMKELDVVLPKLVRAGNKILIDDKI